VIKSEIRRGRYVISVGGHNGLKSASSDCSQAPTALHLSGTFRPVPRRWSLDRHISHRALSSSYPATSLRCSLYASTLPSCSPRKFMTAAPWVSPCSHMSPPAKSSQESPRHSPPVLPHSSRRKSLCASASAVPTQPVTLSLPLHISPPARAMGQRKRRRTAPASTVRKPI
jgi:hypothetical protein